MVTWMGMARSLGAVTLLALVALPVELVLLAKVSSMLLLVLLLVYPFRGAIVK